MSRKNKNKKRYVIRFRRDQPILSTFVFGWFVLVLLTKANQRPLIDLERENIREEKYFPSRTTISLCIDS
jgi:hypothetical protein